MKTFKFTIRGNNYEVDIKSFENDVAKLEVNGTQYNVELHKQEQTTKTPILVRPAVTNPTGSHKIKKSVSNIIKVTAPLPGNIMQIFVNVGDTVKKEYELLMYDAMKMENKLLSEKDGVIKSVNIKAGDSVLQDDLLIEMEIN